VSRRDGLPGEIPGAQRDVFGSRAVVVELDEPVHCVPDGDVHDAVPDGLDHSRHLVRRDGRHARVAGAVHPGLVPSELGRRDPCGVDPYQRLANVRLGSRRLLVRQLLGAAARAGANGVHRVHCGSVHAMPLTSTWKSWLPSDLSPARRW
jgi:hypothetical protein